MDILQFLFYFCDTKLNNLIKTFVNHKQNKISSCLHLDSKHPQASAAFLHALPF